MKPEHFDSSSVECKSDYTSKSYSQEAPDEPNIDKAFKTYDHSDLVSMKSNETFRTKINEYKYAPSASTKFTETMDVVNVPSKLCCKGTTLMLMAAKANRWVLVESLLKLDPEKYPKLLVKEENKKHPLLYKDEHGQDCLLLAILAGEIDIIKLILDKIDSKSLKSTAIQDNKTTVKVLEDLIQGGHANLEEVVEYVFQKIGGKKTNKKRKKQDIKLQKVKLVGKSCRFSFESFDKKSWKCIECDLQISTDEDLITTDNNHYFR